LNLELLAYPFVFLLAGTSIGILIVHSWRWAIILLVIQYAGAFVLTAISWPVQLSMAKVIAGGIAAAVLWMAQSGLPEQTEENDALATDTVTSAIRPHFSGWVFRIFAASIVIMVVISIASAIPQWLPQLSDAQILGSLVLIGIGLLQLGLTSNPFWVILGLLTVLSGFEILYAGVELSALVQGLLSGVNLGLGLVGAYLILSAAGDME
jgi:hypothetical protein